MGVSQGQGDEPPQVQGENPGVQPSLSGRYAVHSEANPARSYPNTTLRCGQHNGDLEGRMVDTTTPYPGKEGDSRLQHMQGVRHQTVWSANHFSPSGVSY